MRFMTSHPPDLLSTCLPLPPIIARLLIRPPLRLRYGRLSRRRSGNEKFTRLISCQGRADGGRAAECGSEARVEGGTQATLSRITCPHPLCPLGPINQVCKSALSISFHPISFPNFSLQRKGSCCVSPIAVPVPAPSSTPESPVLFDPLKTQLLVSTPAG